MPASERWGEVRRALEELARRRFELSPVEFAAERLRILDDVVASAEREASSAAEEQRDLDGVVVARSRPSTLRRAIASCFEDWPMRSMTSSDATTTVRESDGS